MINAQSTFFSNLSTKREFLKMYAVISEVSLRHIHGSKQSQLLS
jgi:hypothetical protein